MTAGCERHLFGPLPAARLNSPLDDSADTVWSDSSDTSPSAMWAGRQLKITPLAY
jgi:hypothetical protein